MLIISHSLSLFFTLFFKVKWLSLIIIPIVILMKFLIDLVIIDYDFLTNDFTSKVKQFILNENLFYSFFFIVLTLKSKLNFFESVGIFIFQDIYSILYLILYIFNIFCEKRMTGIKFFGILIEFFYLLTISIYLLTLSDYLHALGVFTFIIFRSKVIILVKFIDAKKCTKNFLKD